MDWYEWGQEAFDKAKAENKPIFLSVGGPPPWTRRIGDEHTYRLDIRRVTVSIPFPRRFGHRIHEYVVGCHVLAHESFEDELTAKMMNDYYVNVKVRVDSLSLVQLVLILSVRLTVKSGLT